MSRPIRFGVYPLPVGWSWPELRATFQLAEELGFDFAWTHDNVVGPVPWLPDAPVFDAWSVLGALAEATSTIRLGPLVTPMGRRHPAVFAKMTASLDVISGGRLDLGMGPGDEERQFVPWGMPWPDPRERIEILEEELEVVTRLWTQDVASFEGRHYRLDEAVLAPKPVQQPHPPVWIGLIFGRKIMPRVAARWADGVNFYVKRDEDVLSTKALVEAHRRALGRDPADLRWSRNLPVWITEEEGNVDAELERLSATYRVSAEYLQDYVADYERLTTGPAATIVDEIVKQVELGIDHILFNYLMGPGPAFADMPLVEGIHASMRRIAGDVLPLVRDQIGDDAA